ncbi:MAG: biopolymer transporter ExbD [Pyrinomonadaceae bacterium]
MNRPTINVTPLIDVLLVLLIIFMVVTPTKPSDIDARIPSEPKSDKPIRENPNTLVVIYETDGTIMLNREASVATIDDMLAMTSRLHEVFEQRDLNGNRERTVFIKAPPTLDYGSVVKMIDAIKASGADPISLQIDGIEN